MKTLKEIFAEIGHFGSDIGCNDKGGTHSYIESYDRLLLPYSECSNLLEIGLAKGDSIKLWDEYFVDSIIVGADLSIVFEPLQYKNTVTLIAADATRESFTEELPQGICFDIIIDDGSHLEQDQTKTFQMLKSRMRKGGIYIIEDILNLDLSRERFMALHDNCEIIDLRHVKGRFDDVLIVYRF